MVKTPEEIRDGLKICSRSDGCRKCPYHDVPDDDPRSCAEILLDDAAEYIEKMEKEAASHGNISAKIRRFLRRL